MFPKEKMDIPRGPTIALPIPNTTIHIHHRRRPSSRSSSQSSSDSGRPSTSMAIPGARIDNIPPALPPPRYNNDLDDGLDLAWKWQNEHLMTGKSKLAPIKPGSSLLGIPSRPQLARDDDKEEDTDVDLNTLRAASSPSRSRSVTAASIPSLMRSPPPSSGINQRFDRLHGENPLAQQNHNQSTHAYDKHLLLKIGKANSPPGHHKSSSQGRNIPAQNLAIQTRRPSLLLRPVNELSSTFDPVSKWMASPTSAVSPTPKSSWREYSMDPRSPSSDIHPRSATADSEHFLAPNTRSTCPKAPSSQTHSPEDTRSRSERGSYDSAIYAGDVEYMADETSLGSLHIEERPRPAAVHHGIKRRALSPTPELFHEHRIEPPSTRLQRASGPQGTAPRQPYRAASLSSTASSAQYTSSTLSSFAPSSATTLSSLDTPVSHEYSHQFTVSPTPPSARGSAVSILPLRPMSDNSAAAMSTQSPSSVTRTPPARIGNYYICSCCLKKPKKFETEQQLRAHENEKQYTCAYCNNRFKNKNEAERHQNSLHLRKQSWSCAAISTYQAAFHPSSFSNPRNLASDTCGFCGEEFNNHPPNWEERIDHLTNTHKFGECNATKKFYRADHFRQHLKHSHAGKSGKWTNILENNCQREEAVSEAASLSPTASEHSQSGSSCRLQSNLVNPVDASMSGVDTIDEVHEES